MQAVFRAHAQSVLADDLGNFCYRAGCLEPQITDNDKSFVDQNACAFFQSRQRYARIDVAIMIGAANHDVRGFLRSSAEKSADPICGRSHFFDDFLKLLNHPARLNHRFLLIENLRAQLQQFTPNWIARRQRSDGLIERIEKIFRTGVSFPSLQSLTALVAHLVWVNPPNRLNYTVIRHIRNVRRYASTKCSIAIIPPLAAILVVNREIDQRDRDSATDRFDERLGHAGPQEHEPHNGNGSDENGDAG